MSGSVRTCSIPRPLASPSGRGGTAGDGEGVKYEIRKDGKTHMAWTDPSCGYSKATLAGMKKHGYRLYINGRPQR